MVCDQERIRMKGVECLVEDDILSHIVPPRPNPVAMGEPVA
jgi:hypothetical protein